MNQHLRDALLNLLFRHMAEHVNRGLGYDEALILGVAEIRRQIRGSRQNMADMLIDQAVLDVRFASEHGAKLH